MATSSIAAAADPSPSVKTEHDRTPLQHEEQQALTVTINPKNSPSQSQSQAPHFINSIDQLRNLSIALSTFQRRYDELQDHLDFIRKSIDSKFPNHLLQSSAPQLEISPVTQTLTPTPAPLPIQKKIPATDKKSGKIKNNEPSPPVPQTVKKSGKIKTSEPSPLGQKAVPATEKKSGKDENSEPPPIQKAVPATDNANSKPQTMSELENLCKAMSSKGLRKYVIARVSNFAKLRVELPAALKLASNPAKLVLESVGGFYRQSSISFKTNPDSVGPRRASIFILECFLLMGVNGSGIEPAVRNEADNAAFAWRKRMISEGGISKAYKIDARGLLLFIGCFGIPRAFMNEEIIDLIKGNHAVEVAEALRRSSVLVARIPDIIEVLVKNRRQVEAVDIIYTFGVESRFPPQAMLTSFLEESEESWKQNRTAAQGSLPDVIQANKKHLAHLKSVLKCLDGHKIDHLKLLPGCQINEKIFSLERDIADLDKKIGGEKAVSKRKRDENELLSKRLDLQEEKRLRYDAMSSYDSYQPIKMLGSGFPGALDTYSPSSPQLLHRYGGGGGGLFPENGRSRGGVLAAGDPAMSSIAAAGIRERLLLERGGGGQMMMSSDPLQPYEREMLIGHGFPGQPLPANMGVVVNGGSSYRAASVVAGLQSSPSNRSSVSDLYRFADVVDESESFRDSRSRATDTDPRGRRTSYLY